MSANLTVTPMSLAELVRQRASLVFIPPALANSFKTPERLKAIVSAIQTEVVRSVVVADLVHATRLSSDVASVLAIHAKSAALLDGSMVGAPSSPALLVFDYSPEPQFPIPSRTSMAVIGSARTFCGISRAFFDFGASVANANYIVFVNLLSTIGANDKAKLCAAIEPIHHELQLQPRLYSFDEMLRSMREAGVPEHFLQREAFDPQMLAGIRSSDRA